MKRATQRPDGKWDYPFFYFLFGGPIGAYVIRTVLAGRDATKANKAAGRSS